MYTSGNIYSASFSATALTTNPYDVFGLLAPTNSRVVVREIKIGQYSDAGDAQAEMLSVVLLRGSTASSTAGTAVTPVNRKGHTGATSAGSSVLTCSTALASTASAVQIEADAFNVASGYRHYPVPSERLVLEKSQRLHVRITAPNDALTVNGTITFEEVGQIPV